MNKRSKITPTQDIVFKRLFGVKGREDILKDLLEAILDEKIERVELDLATEMIPEYKDKKTSTLDIRANLNNNIQANIEMQIDVEKYSEKRCLQYWSRLYSNELDKGEDYTDLKRTICIWILDGEVYNEFSKYHSKWKIVETELGIKAHFNELEIHIIELQKFRNSVIIRPKKKEFWLWFLDDQNKEMIDLACIDDKKIARARKELEKISADKELQDIIRRQELYEHDEIMKRNIVRKKAREDGIAKGKKEKSIEIAKKLLEKGMSLEEVESVTGISKKEIEKL